jgi:hypothetical protein
MKSELICWRYLPVNKPKNLSHAQIHNSIKHAANEWNKAFEGLVYFQEGTGDLQIRFSFDLKINKSTNPTRIGECRQYSNPRRWEVSFDVRDSWNVGGWRRVLGVGNDLRSTALHEFGHVIQIPHSLDKSFIMFSDYNENIKLYDDEIKCYREFFIKNVL